MDVVDSFHAYDMTLDCSNVLHTCSPHPLRLQSSFSSSPDPQLDTLISSTGDVIENCEEFLQYGALIKQSWRHRYFSF